MSVVPVLQRIEGLQIAELGPAGVAMALADVTRVERYLTSVKLTLTQRAGALAAEGHGAPAAETVKRNCRASSGEAAKVEAAARTAAASPALNQALAAGAVGLDHVNAYGTVERGLTDPQKERLRDALPALLPDAQLQTPEEFRAALAAQARQIRTDDGEAQAAQQRRDRRASFGTAASDQIGWLSARFDPETAARVFAHLGAERDRLLAAERDLTPEQATADALANLVLRGGRAGHVPTREAIVEVVAFVDLESLLHGAHAGGVSYLSSGAAVPVSQIRRLCCQARVLPMVLDGEGRPLDVGRAQRLATREQRRALRKLHATCAFPDCHTPFDECEVHHVVWFERLGRTDLANLAPLCSRHHHLVHEGGWRLTMTAERTVRTYRPDGTHHATTRWRPPAGEHPRQPVDTLTRRRATADPPDGGAGSPDAAAGPHRGAPAPPSPDGTPPAVAAAQAGLPREQSDAA